jgi:hypothetical protein
MRLLASLLLIIASFVSVSLLTPARAAGAHADFATADDLINWANDYREHRQPWRLPQAVHAMEQLGLFGDDEKGGFCIGFIAGVLGTNPKDGSKLVAGMFPLTPKDQAVIIKAIAYSGRPDWQDLLVKYAPKMPLRKPLIDDFLDGRRPLLMDAPLATGGPTLIYTLWGYYTATGQYQPVLRIIQALQWSRNKEDPGFSWGKLVEGWTKAGADVDKATTGGTAKWTLASYAERNRELLNLYRAEEAHQPPEIAEPLREVVQAASLFESDEVRKDQLGAIADAQHRKAEDEAGMSKLATAGSIGIATGCVAASALGQAEVAVPCVIGGALYTGAVKLMH